MLQEVMGRTQKKKSFLGRRFQGKPYRGVLAVILPLILSAAQPGPSSEIPLRREFPVNPAVRPCDDFYKYSCSKVESSFKLPDDRSKHDFAFNDSSERLLKAKQAFLERLSSAKEAPSTPRQQDLATFFRACMNERAGVIEEKEWVTSLQGQVDAIKNTAEFREFIGSKILSLDFGIYSFGNLPNLDKPEIYDFFVMSDLMTLPERSYYEKAEVVHDFEEVAADFMVAMGRDRPQERARALVDFEREFAQSFPLPEDFRELFSSRTKISKKELITLYPNLNLDPLLLQVPDTTIIRNLTPANFSWLNEAFIRKPLETLGDLYLWHALAPHMDDAYPQFFDKYFRFKNKHLGGPPQRPVRAERCTWQVMESFNKEIDAELVDTVFPDFPVDRFRAMADRVRRSIVGGIQANTWLSAEAKAKAVEKMQKATLQLVKPMTDDEWDFNPKVTYADDKPLSNRRQLLFKLMEKELVRLQKPRNRNEWGMGPLTVNAYYSASDNKFVMPIGILQPPFFDPQESDETNLGSIGSVIGHELGHGIDDKGSRYDAEGRLVTWMTPADLAEFSRRGNKLVEQFRRAGHNGTLTLGENIGDLVGLSFAYQSAFGDGKGTVSQKRAFFLQYARVWCTVIRPKTREALLKTDPHAMGEARVNEQMKHQAGFAEAYSCKAHDKMFLAPQKRVRIW